MTYSNEYSEGKAAAVIGEYRKSNPYSSLTEFGKWLEWDSGWIEGFQIFAKNHKYSQ